MKKGGYGGGMYGGMGGYGGGGAVPGFTVPAVQQCQQQYGGQQHYQQQGYGGHQQQPQQRQPPPSMHMNHMQQNMSMGAMRQMQEMMMAEEGLIDEDEIREKKERMRKRQKKMNRRNRRRNRKNRDDDYEDSEEEEEEEEEEEDDKAAMEAMKKEMEEEFKKEMEKLKELQQKLKDDPEKKLQIKNKLVNELMRRQEVNGTFDITEGTVKPFLQYTADDPVTQYMASRPVPEDITGNKWSAEVDCMYLNEAMDGCGTNDDAIILVSTTRCNAQRQELKKYYKIAFSKDLLEALYSELSGDFQEIIMGLYIRPALYDAWCIKESIYGLGTDEVSLLEILMTRTNAQIKEMTEEFANITSKSAAKKNRESTRLEDDIEDDTSGDFKRLLISACQGGRSEIPREQLEQAVEEVIFEGEPSGMFQLNYKKLADDAKAKRDAEILFKAGEDKWGTDEQEFTRIFSTRDFYQLRETWDQYVKLAQRDITNSIDRETSGDYKRGLVAIAENIKCRPMMFARRLERAMKGLGTDEKTLTRIIISRSEIDLVQIKQCFLEITKQTLWRWIKDDTSFNYKKVLLALVGKD